MKITFKDVGQGDSIILEWRHNNIDKIGIIDCCKKGRSNPVLEFLKKSNYSQIEFIILSHPHSDHYSGMMELLEHCDSKEIMVGGFYHTIKEIGNKYWKYFEIDSKDNDQLKKLMTLAQGLHDKKTLEIKYLTEGYQIPLFPKAYLRCLSPSHDEIKECQRIMEFDPIKNVKKQSSAANYLATVFKLNIDNEYALLTSDAEKLAFQTILERRMDLLDGKRMVLGQMSHHGSFKSYHDVFWSTIPRKIKNPVVASAGKNDKYKHPDLSTLEAYQNNKYEIRCTSSLYGMTQFVDKINANRRIASKLDTFSIEAEEYYHFGDHEFLWKDLL